MMPSLKFQTLFKEKLRYKFAVKANSPIASATGCISVHPSSIDNCVGEVPSDVRICSSSGERVLLASSRAYAGLIVGVEYLRKLGASDQSPHLEQEQSRGVVVYEGVKTYENNRIVEIAQAFFDLETETVSYAGLNNYAQEVMPSFLEIHGLDLHQGIDSFFAMLPRC